jgi:hypothetical protein
MGSGYKNNFGSRTLGYYENEGNFNFDIDTILFSIK